MSQIISSFTPPNLYLSSFYMEAPLIVEGITFPSVHQAFYAEMTEDIDIKIKLSRLTNVAEIRALGQSIIEPDTNELQIHHMYLLNKRKFTEYPVLGVKLKALRGWTLINNLLYEDPLWGKYQGKGNDNLGKILMQLSCEI